MQHCLINCYVVCYLDARNIVDRVYLGFGSLRLL